VGEATTRCSFFATNRQIRSFFNIPFQRGKEGAQANLAKGSHRAASSKRRGKAEVCTTCNRNSCRPAGGRGVGLGATAASKILALGLAHELDSGEMRFGTCCLHDKPSLARAQQQGSAAHHKLAPHMRHESDSSCTKPALAHSIGPIG